MRRNMFVGFLVGCFMLASVPVLAGQAEEAAKLFAEGKALLAKADFEGASQAFRKAAQTDTGNQEYRRQYAMIRQVMRTRGQIDKEQDPDRWWGMARSLRAYYHGHKIYSEALPLDRTIHRRRGTADSAAMLGETQLALGMHSEAAETLRSVSEEDATNRTNVLWGLALARQGRIDEAKTIAKEVTVKDDAGSRVFYQLACLRALIADSKGALEALTRSFELTPSDQLEAAIADAKACKDFSALASTADFAKALQTQSKVKESKCSKGPGCGSCPKRASCGGSAGKDAKEPSTDKKTDP